MQFNKHAVVLLPGREPYGTHFFPQKNAFPTILMLPLSFSTNFNGITDLRQNTYRAIILAKNFACAPRAGFSHFLEAFFLSFLMKYIPLIG